MNDILNQMNKIMLNYDSKDEIAAKSTIKDLRKLFSDLKVTDFCNKNNFRVQIFKGVGKYPLSPWVAFLSNDLNYTIQRGYYICYLVDVRIEKIYLTVTSGTENLKMDEIKQNALLAKYMLGTECNLDLGRKTGRPYKYAIASSYSKEYLIKNYYSSLEKDLLDIISLFNKTFIKNKINEFDYTEAIIAEALLDEAGMEEAEITVLEETPPPESKHKSRQEGEVRISKRNYVAKTISDMKIGIEAEKLVVKSEINRLIGLGYPEYANKVIKMSDIGDGYGYDIESYDIFNGKVEKIFIEVKGTVKDINQSFYITSNELKVSKEKDDKYFIYRVYNLYKKPKYYRIRGSLYDNLELIPINYRAYIL